MQNLVLLGVSCLSNTEIRAKFQSSTPQEDKALSDDSGFPATPLV